MYSDMEKIPCKLYPRLLGDLSKMYLGLDALGAGPVKVYICLDVLVPVFTFYSGVICPFPPPLDIERLNKAHKYRLRFRSST